MKILAAVAVTLMLLGSSPAACAAGLLPERSWQAPVTDEASARRQITSSPADRLEGIWSTTADGARIAVTGGEIPGQERTLAKNLLLVVLESPRPAIAPGTVMGWCRPTAKEGCYEGYVFTRCDGPELSSPRRIRLQLTDGSRLLISELRKSLAVEFLPWKLLPYMFRAAVKVRHEQPEKLDGFLRLWPCGNEAPQRPRYL